VSTHELMNIVQARGLSIVLDNGRPVIKRARDNHGAITDKLLAVLKRHRERIIAILSREGERP
jgi:hypothetical protein